MLGNKKSRSEETPKILESNEESEIEFVKNEKETKNKKKNKNKNKHYTTSIVIPSSIVDNAQVKFINLNIKYYFFT